MYEQIRYEVDDPVAIITLNCSQALNAWTETMDVEVRDALNAAAGDPKGYRHRGHRRRPGVLRRRRHEPAQRHPAVAANAGGPVAIVRRGNRDDGADDFDGRFPYVMAIDKPVIAAINGAVAGMASPFALCCDIAV